MLREENVIELASAESVEAAWNRYAVKARQLVDAPELLCDRQFSQDLARLYERWKRLFLIQDVG